MVKRRVNAGDNTARWAISPATTTLGVKQEFSQKAKGVVELDFIDFSQSQGNVAVRPRLRQAYLDYKPEKNYGIFIGQKWDIFGPVRPHTFNLVSKFFQAGDTGWQREQVGAWLDWEAFTFTIAAGTVGRNSTPDVVLGIEKNSAPTLAGQIKWAVSESTTVYLSALTVDMKVRQPLIDSNRDGTFLQWDVQNINSTTETFPLAYRLGGDGTTRLKSGGYAFGFVSKPMDRLEIKSEAIYASNLGNLNALGASQALSRTYAQSFQQSKYGYITSNDVLLNQILSSQQPLFYSITEMGGWLTFNYKFSETWQGGLQIGTTRIVNQDDLQGADEANLFTSQPSGTTWLNRQIVGSVRENGETGFRLSYHPEKKLTFFLQSDYKRTFYKNQERYQGIGAHIESFNISDNTLTLRSPVYSYLKSQGVVTAISVRSGAIYKF
ncbi:MAG: hypothetical protein AAF518_16220 [Spirochaetota bacterium]